MCFKRIITAAAAYIWLIAIPIAKGNWSVDKVNYLKNERGDIGGIKPDHTKASDGYPLANFGLTVSASQSGNILGRILQNSGELGKWLVDKGAIDIGIEKHEKYLKLEEFTSKRIKREFPFIENTYRDLSLINSGITVKAFCPLATNDARISSLPTLLAEIEVENNTLSSEQLAIRLSTELLLRKVKQYTGQFYTGYGTSDFQISSDCPIQYEKDTVKIPIKAKSGKKQKIKLVFSFYSENWTTSNEFANTDELTQFVFNNWSELEQLTAKFSGSFPTTGDIALDDYLRWYAVPAISLTRITKKNEVLTMGYSELNQRDSYWTSFLHLVLFKDLEKKMIDESISHQQNSGKIPTTILPLIEREDDLDINAFFILRASRYYRYYKDKRALKEQWGALTKAMDWLISRDLNGNGLPVQHSFWGDWKDVKGVEGRKYAPFSGLIYLAALKEMIFLGKEIDESEASNRYEKKYKKGYDFINKDVKAGGLWNGRYYCQIWHDGSVNERLLQDQTIGILFDVVPKDRANSIFEELNHKSLTAYGIAETTPYYPKEWGYEPATYHNGAVWPWLSFMDCWARIRTGRKREAIDLVKRVAKADLVDSEDWSPNEHINSLTGENLGFHLQGWNAGLFGLVYFGLQHPGILP